MIACGMDPAREAIAQRTIKETPQARERRLAKKNENAKARRFDKKSALVQKVLLLRDEVKALASSNEELRLIVKALESRIDCQLGVQRLNVQVSGLRRSA